MVEAVGGKWRGRADWERGRNADAFRAGAKKFFSAYAPRPCPEPSEGTGRMDPGRRLRQGEEVSVGVLGTQISKASYVQIPFQGFIRLSYLPIPAQISSVEVEVRTSSNPMIHNREHPLLVLSTLEN